MADLNDAVGIEEAYLPNRAYRRKNAGARCGMCGLGITAGDFALVNITVLGGTAVRPIHKQCTSLLWEMAANLNKEANATSEADEMEDQASAEGLDS